MASTCNRHLLWNKIGSEFLTYGRLKRFRRGSNEELTVDVTARSHYGAVDIDRGNRPMVHRFDQPGSRDGGENHSSDNRQIRRIFLVAANEFVV